METGKKDRHGQQQQRKSKREVYHTCERNGDGYLIVSVSDWETARLKDYDTSSGD